MVAGIIGSLRSLVWVLILLACMKYIFAMCILEVASHTMGKGEARDPEMLKYFGSVMDTMSTLFQSISGGVNWEEAEKPLRRVNVALALVFVVYIAFAMFCVLNIITGVFVESAKQMTAADQDMVLMEQLESRDQWFEEVRQIFLAADADGSGQVNGEEFTQRLKEDTRLQAQFRKIGVQVEAYSASGLFKLLDFEGDGELDLDDFCLALQMVHGTARSIDVAKINHDCRALRRGLYDLSDLCAEYFSEL